MPDVRQLLERLERGDQRALARLLTVVEDGDPGLLREIISTIHPRTGHARILGITGSPGVGKSTLTSAFATALRARHRSVAILAVDPSSPFSGGALLGDRVRMQGHHADAGVYIRSMASRGHLGGLSSATPQAVEILDAAGFDDVIVETVGVGQSEVEIAAAADTTVVAIAPGMGDSVQAAKAGILEVADVLVINKADRGGAGQLESQLRAVLEMDHELQATDGAPAWWPPIVRTVALRGDGIGDVVAAVDDHGRHLTSSGGRHRRRQARARHMVRALVLETVRRRVARLGDEEGAVLDRVADAVADQRLDPYAAADELLAAIDLAAADATPDRADDTRRRPRAHPTEPTGPPDGPGACG